jgi:riboflavin synthase
VFTGIVTGVGRVRALDRRGGHGTRLTVLAPKRFGGFRRGESVAVSGVCVTAIENGRRLVADISRETLSVTTLGALATGDPVNLERSLEWRGTVAGHFVLGHVDAVARVLSMKDSRGSWTYRFSIPRGLGRFIVRKGSVAIDGVSLTVAARRVREFDVAVIPETRRVTTLGERRAGDPVNVEVDLLARYGRLPRGPRR